MIWINYNEIMENCTACTDGRLKVECCNGSNCSCKGDTVDMGICRVCDGTGLMDEAKTGRENVDFLRGLNVGYLGRSLDGSKRLGE